MRAIGAGVLRKFASQCLTVIRGAPITFGLSVLLLVSVLWFLSGCRAATIAAAGAYEATRPGATPPWFAPSPFLYQSPLLPLGPSQCYAERNYIGGYSLRCY